MIKKNMYFQFVNKYHSCPLKLLKVIKTKAKTDKYKLYAKYIANTYGNTSNIL